MILKLSCAIAEEIGTVFHIHISGIQLYVYIFVQNAPLICAVPLISATFSKCMADKG